MDFEIVNVKRDDMIDFINLEREYAKRDLERARWVYGEAHDAREEARVYRNQGVLLDVLGVVLLGLIVAALIVGRMV